jgi:hypothetical protein
LAINPEYLTYPFAFIVDETWYTMPSSTIFLRLDEREREREREREGATQKTLLTKMPSTKLLP